MRATLPVTLLFSSVAFLNASTIVYDNGAPAFQGLYSLVDPNGYLVDEADSFTFTSSETVTNGVFWTYEFDNIYPSQTPNLPPGVDWWIDSDSSGMPGSTIASGSSPERVLESGLQMADPGAVGLGEGYEVDFSLGSVTLGPGTYYLVLSEPKAIYWGIGWIDTATIVDGCCFFFNAPFETAWRDRSTCPASTIAECLQDPPVGNELAFELFDGDPAGAPEPSALWLMGIGLGLGWIGFRRTRTSKANGEVEETRTSDLPGVEGERAAATRAH